ncbi:MAG: hypothetical protein RL514_3236 [Verrucomicrobiota bacterium]|jgi:transcription elongation factor GreB
MSKAFTREDDRPEPPVVTRRASSLPPGTQNLMTPDGVERFRAELGSLQIAREELLAQRGGPDQPQQLAALEQRALLLDASLRTASIVPLPVSPDDRVRFGATVTVRADSGAEARHRIVGVDEVDFDQGWVSWRSPLARALLNARLGQRVRVQLPGGEQELEILAVTYHSSQ